MNLDKRRRATRTLKKIFIYLFADFCKIWAISAMDIVFRLKGAILQVKIA